MPDPRSIDGPMSAVGYGLLALSVVLCQQLDMVSWLFQWSHVSRWIWSLGSLSGPMSAVGYGLLALSVVLCQKLDMVLWLSPWSHVIIVSRTWSHSSLRGLMSAVVYGLQFVSVVHVTVGHGCLVISMVRISSD